MKFSTSVPILDQKPKIDHTSKILLLGSCFVENIGEKLDYFQFQNLRNPFGIFYHPEAIGNFIEKVAGDYSYEEDDVFFHNEQWHCFDAHSCMNSSSKEELLFQLNDGIQKARTFIKNATHIIFTFGTSWHYKELKTDRSVANCHKIEQKNFKKELLSVKKNEIVFNNVLQRLLTINPEVKLIFTVSPVRHLKDGFIENQQSKAHLIAAIHNFIASQKNVNTEACFYFPAYEIMLDELRDYRFYSEDMVHPNSLAIDYIWSRFTEAWVSKKASEKFKSIETIHRGLGHKPFNKNSEKHQEFLRDLEKKNSRFKR
ncbi:GSCFA domain-containing protein [Gillisia marina]|uniref:GSCFA domain-containing protein n=1 Tax=Gillisia marina TaxID=1167637 RepID=UPI00029AD971|nr:GSCFA domain-containing protein [Gillisia marina]